MRHHVGLAIDETTGDVFTTGNVLGMVYEAEAVGQHARQRLMTFYGEWFLDTSAGVRWIQDIFAKAYDHALAEATVKNNLLETDGILAIETFVISFDRLTRGIFPRDIVVKTVYDETVNV